MKPHQPLSYATRHTPRTRRTPSELLVDVTIGTMQVVAGIVLLIVTSVIESTSLWTLTRGRAGEHLGDEQVQQLPNGLRRIFRERR